ncbi:MAG TPA: hypothetical protein VL404_09515 [Candidatus Eisenbacteria bacterium]|nr:hypothetical protein [Candidatus Eisenbacteria bacterium]
MKKAAALFVFSAVLACATAQAAEAPLSKEELAAKAAAAPKTAAPALIVVTGRIVKVASDSLSVSQKGGAEETVKIAATTQFNQMDGTHQVTGKGTASSLKAGMFVDVLIGEGTPKVAQAVNYLNV